MKKIMMTKYGFVRDAQNDFSDDGNCFQVYKAGTRVRVSKLIDDGKAYISARIDDNILPYEAYSALPHYRDLDALNGVSIATLTETDLEELYKSCLAYEEEYTRAEQTIKMPTIEEITEQCERIKAKRVAELTTVRQLLALNVVEAAQKLGSYEWRNIQDYIKNLAHIIEQRDPKTYPQSIVGTSASFSFVKPNYSELKDCYYYEYIVECLTTKIGIRTTSM